MRRILYAVLCLALLPAAAPPSVPDPVPRFEAYPAGPVFRGRNRLVLGRNDMAFRTRLREAAAQKSDFAGQYVLAQWGCGTECISGAAIDVRTGRVVWLPGTLCCWFSEKSPHANPVEPLRYRLNSRLLVLSGRRNERDGDDGEHYYVIDGDRLVHLRDVPATDRR